MEEFIDLEIWAFVLGWRVHKQILHGKEVPEGMMVLLVARAKCGGNPVIVMSWQLGLHLYLLGELQRWCKPIKNVDAKHRDDILVGEWVVLTSKDVTLLPSTT
jgi:hypothetical protein